MDGQYSMETLFKLVVGTTLSLIVMIVFSQFMGKLMAGLGDPMLAEFVSDLILVAAPVAICMLFFMGYGVYKLSRKKI